ncbi:LysR family transcriptional regulator [Myxococcus landrumensis]|uniref:LysR family transcriptional regulator n=1 Tax=Myxococcus landrumensis TaxID=2813577 RepID=A0ABX7NHP1_9BACT|nr:LysR family transcriptional regulator [Myxococcus landrumus]QSQ17874.1 LysR family transcriptional regulator [Myxococcus landrumus]
MFDPITLDQLRAFVTVVEEGSFSAAARKLRRVQSAISTSMANLEAQLGVLLWDRSTKVATLTAQGQAVLASTRRVLAEVDGLRRLTTGMTLGLEASVSLCLDAFFPVKALVSLCANFTQEFPAVDLRIDTQVMSAVSARVLDGTATLGVVTPAGLARGLEVQALSPIRVHPVVSPSHPLAAIKGRIASRHFVDAIQIVLSECENDGVSDQVGLSPRTWRVGDLNTKHEMLRAGLGWGNLPEHLIREDLRKGKLVTLRPAAWGDHENSLNLLVIHRSDAVFGPAHRWLMEQLARLCAKEARLQK